MYFVDTPTGVIESFDYDPAHGTIGQKRSFARVDEHAGRPDGATVDQAGYLWSAGWDGWCVTRYAPDGRVDRRLPVPVRWPTSCAFGGPALDVLFVTSASQGLSAAALADQPLAGRVLAARPGPRGLAEAPFRL